METPEIVTGAVPVEVKTTGKVGDCPTYTLPKLMLVALILSDGVLAFSCRTKLFETPLAVAVNVTDCVVLTEDTVAGNATLGQPSPRPAP
jgi:hypothetical protein